jgi:hypothetical protein
VTLLEVALRVLACYRDRGNPDPADVQILRSAVADAGKGRSPDDLAVEIVDRETESLRRKRINGAAEQTQGKSRRRRAS